MRVGLGCLAALIACAGEGPAAPPHLVLVVVDTLRADRLGAYGHDRPTSPSFDGLAAEGVLFTRAFAPSSWTKPSVGSLFTSRLSSEHGIARLGDGLDDAVPVLAELLRDAGYHTIAVSGNPIQVAERFGFARGFDVFEPLMMPAPAGAFLDTLEIELGGRRQSLRLPRAREVNQRLLRRLPAETTRPLFLYVHYVDPHTPYAPTRPFRETFRRDAGERPDGVSTDALIEMARTGREPDAEERRWLFDLYDAEVAQVDAALGELLAELERRGLARNAVVVVTADHGEEFGDHGGWGHGLTLHDEVLRAPLALRDFRRPGVGARRDEAVDLLDVPTTLLALAGVEAAPGMRGRNLLAEGALPERDLVLELLKGRSQHRRALLRGPWKLLVHTDGSHTWYRLDRDPGEREPLGPADPRVPEALSLELSRVEASLPDPRGLPEPSLDAGTRDALEALGYLR